MTPRAAAAAAVDRRWLLGIAGICLAAVAAALLAQYGWDMRPCPWCILQRVIFLLIAGLALVAVACGRAVRVLLAGLVALLAVGGVAAAVYQHVVAAKQFSCNLTFADRMLDTFGIEKLWPAVFQVTATCAEAAVSLLGVPFEYWSLLLFALIAVAALRVSLARPRLR